MLKKFTLIFFLTISQGLIVTDAFAQPCVDGFAGIFPCNFVDQISFMDLDLFSAANTNDVWGWTSPQTGREYVLMGAANKTAFIDISSPEYPIYLGFLPTRTQASLWRDIKVIDNYAYIVSEASDHGLQVFDLRRLESLTSEQIPQVFVADAEYLGFGNSHNVVVNTESKYVYGVGTSDFNGGLHIVDVDDPMEPVFAGSSGEAGYIHDGQAVIYNGPDNEHVGKEIFLGFNDEIVAVYDVTDKTDVEVLSMTDYENVGYVHQGWFTEDHRYAISNDELDERDFGINTRPILWDMSDLDNPQVISYVDLGTNSVDHNLYIVKDLIYMSNYQSGLRIRDIIDIADGHLEPTAFFDVIPEVDNTQFRGTWSNYPYFESGIIPVTNMYRGLHMLKPQYFQLEEDVVRVCDASSASLSFSINRRLMGTVEYSVEMGNTALGVVPNLLFNETDGAPADNILLWTSLGATPPGSYSGEVVIDHDGGQERLPFVLIKEGEDEPNAPELNFPTGEILFDQEVDFSFSDEAGSYLTLQVALDTEFEEIVFEEVIYGGSGSYSAEMPFYGTTYFYRFIKETACGDPVLSDVQSFTIDISVSATDVDPQDLLGVFPNPASDRVSVYLLDKSVERLELMDLSGRVLKEIPALKGRELVEIDLSDLASGVYLISIPNTGIAQKLIKN